MDNHVYAVDTDSGDELWRFRTGGSVTSSPAVVNGTVFVGEGNLTTGTGTSLVYDGATGQVLVSSSSARYKTDIEPHPTEPGAILDLEPRSFEYESTGQPDVGLIAEEVAEHVPELVNTDEEGRPESVNYDRLGVHLVPELRRQRDRIDDLEAENERLRERVEAIEGGLDGPEAS